MPIINTKYKVSVEKIEVIEYPENETVYIDLNGEETTNYDRKEKSIYKPTGKMLTREDKRYLYSQEFENIDIKDIITAANNIK